MMKILGIKEEAEHLLVSIEADSEMCKYVYSKHFVNLSKRIALPGFRKGHAPMEMVIKYLKSRDQWGRECQAVISKIIENSVQEISKSEKELDERVFGMPIENRLDKFDQEKWEVSFESKFEKFPEVSLNDYSSIPTLFEPMEIGEGDCLVNCQDSEITKENVVFVSLVCKDEKGKMIDKYIYEVLMFDLSKTEINKEIVDCLLGAKVGEKKVVKVKDGESEIEIDLTVLENNKKVTLEQAIKELKFKPEITMDSLKTEVIRRSKEYNGVIRHRDVIKWLLTHKLNPLPIQNLRREASQTYQQLLRRGMKNIKFESVFWEHIKNLTTSLTLREIAKKEKIEIVDGDKELFATHIEENPWIYGNKRVEDVFNYDEEVLKEFILQFKVFKFLDERLKFSN